MLNLFETALEDSHNLLFDPKNFKTSEIIQPGSFDFEDAVEIITIKNLDNKNFNFCAQKSVYLNKFGDDGTESLKKYQEHGIEAVKDTKQYKVAVEEVNKFLSHPDVDKSIPKKYWDKFSNFIGVNQQVICHPHFFQAFFNEVEELKNKEHSDTLVMINCSNKKPYNSTPAYNRYIKASLGTRLFDLCILSVYPTMLTPIDTSVRYPHICYNWPHTDSESLLSFRSILCAFAIYYLIKNAGYKHVINLDFGHNSTKIKHLRDIFGINVINFYDFVPYKTIIYYIFSTKIIDPVTNTFKIYKGIPKLRFQSSQATSQFMLDLFGPALEPYFSGLKDSLFWTDPNRDAILKMANWDTGRVERIKF